MSQSVCRLLKCFFLPAWLWVCAGWGTASGEEIAFVMRDDTRHDEIFLLDPTGEVPVQITRHRLRPRELVWSPDHRSIAFVGGGKPGIITDQDGLYFLDVAKKTVTKMYVFPFPAARGGWSRDGETLYWSMEGVTRILAFQNGRLKEEIVGTPFRFGSFPDKDVEFRFFGGQERSDYEIVLVKNGERKRLTTNRVRDAYPALSPTGLQIAYISERDRTPQMLVMNEAGGGVQTLLRLQRNRFPRMLVWAPGYAWPTGEQNASVTGSPPASPVPLHQDPSPPALVELPPPAAGPKEKTPPAPFLPPKSQGRLEVASDPAGASVFLNRVVRGTTPLVIDALSPGSYLLRISAGQHYKPAIRTVQVVKGETAQVRVTLAMTTEKSLIEGIAAFGKGRLAEAERLLRQAVTDLPRKPEAYFLLGLLARDRGQNAEAILFFRNYVNFRPEILDSYYYLGELYQDEGEWAQALTSLKRFLSGIPAFQTLTSHPPPGTDAFQGHLERLLEKEPNNQEARFQLALLMEQKGRFQEGTETLFRIIEGFPASFPGGEELLFFKRMKEVRLSALSKPIPTFLLPTAAP